MRDGLVSVAKRFGAASNGLHSQLIVVELHRPGFAGKGVAAGVDDGATAGAPNALAMGVAHDDELRGGSVVGGKLGGELGDRPPVTQYTPDGEGVTQKFGRGGVIRMRLGIVPLGVRGGLGGVEAMFELRELLGIEFLEFGVMQ